MGGGTVMRSAAAKVAGLGFIGNYRGIPSSVPLAERVLTARNSAIPFPYATVFPSPSNQNQIVNNSTLLISSSIPRPSCEVNDWEFIEDEQQQNIIDFMDRTPRLSFGAVPNLEEAKEAISDLKDALQKMYFSCTSGAGGDVSSTNIQRSTSPRPSEVCVASHSEHAFQAFSMLQNSPEVQDVVASLTSDKNVWEAVMTNEKVMELYKKTNKNMGGSTSGVEGEKSPENNPDIGEPFGSSAMSLMQTIKLKVLAMVKNLSELFHCIHINPMEGNSYGNNIWNNSATGTVLVVLAMATIMVVMVKRA